LAKLSPEDRALAEKQKTCPVSGEPLGSMGVPYKLTVQGRDVLLCCPGCEDRGVLVLRHLGERTTREAAAALGTTEPMVRYR